MQGIGKAFSSQFEMKRNMRRRYHETFAMLRLQKAFLKEGSQARSKVCKETINKDRNILSGIKKLLDATEWPEGIEN